MSGNKTRRVLSRFLFRAWPFPFAHVKLMQLIKPPQLPCDSITTKLPGYPLIIKYNPNTFIGKYIYYRGIFEEQIIKKMCSLLRPGMIFLDVGANIGLHTIVAANRIGNTGKVISIEPQQKVSKLLMNNVKLNNLENVSIFQCALGNKKTKMELYQINNNNDGQATLAADAKKWRKRHRDC